MSKILIVSFLKKSQPRQSGNRMSQLKITVFGEIPQDFEESGSEGRKEPEILFFHSIPTLNVSLNKGQGLTCISVPM